MNKQKIDYSIYGVRYEVGLEYFLLHIHFYSILEEKNGMGMEMPSVTTLTKLIFITNNYSEKC